MLDPAEPSSLVRPPADLAPRGDDQRLERLLGATSSEALAVLAQRLGIVLDPNKRISETAQLARALLALPWARDLGVLPVLEQECVRALLGAGGSGWVSELGRVHTALHERGLLWIRSEAAGGYWLRIPLSVMLQLGTWEGEDPRCLRALLAATSEEAVRNVAAFYLGRTPVRPYALALESAYLEITDAARVRAAVTQLPSAERAVLLAVEALGGEVDTEELLELEREPLRMRGASGVTPMRRGVGYALERRGYLLPLAPNRHVIPLEVERVVGERRAEERDRRRNVVKHWVTLDHAPSRARAALDSATLTTAVVLTARGGGHSPRAGVAVARSFLRKTAELLGADEDAVALLAALSRSLHLWDAARDTGRELVSFSLAELAVRLLAAWRRGGIWDETRLEPEVRRGPSSSAQPPAANVLRELVLEALHVLADGVWVPLRAIAEYVASDTRAAGIERLAQRWSARSGCEIVDLTSSVQRIVSQSLWALGVIDVGELEHGAGEATRAVRLSARGRRLLAGQALPSEQASRFSATTTLLVGNEARLDRVLELAPWVDLGRIQGGFELHVDRARVAQAVTEGASTRAIQDCFAAVAPIPDELGALIEQAAALVDGGHLVPSAGFLWLPDEAVRSRVLASPRAHQLFVDPSPREGLLLAPGVTLARVQAVFRSLGLRVGGPVTTPGVAAPSHSGTARPRRTRGKQAKR